MTDYFGDIRSIVMGQPSLSGWYKILKLINNIDPDEQLDVVVPYLHQHMDHRWPDVLRPVPPQLITLTTPMPWLSLARTLTIGELPMAHYEHVLNNKDIMKITCLKLDKNMEIEHLLACLDNPVFDLKCFILAKGRHVFNEKNWRRLFKHPSLFHLETFKASSQNMTTNLLKRILNHPMMHTVQAFEVASFFTGARLKSLCNNKVVPKLTAMYLQGNCRDVIEQFVNTPELSKMRYLSMHGTAIGDEGLRHLLNSPMHHLEYLNVGGCNLTDESYHMLGKAQNLSQLQCLWLWTAIPSKKGLEALLNNTQLKSLNRLNLNNNNLDHEDLKILATSQLFPKLKTLNLNGMSTSLNSLQQLFKYDNMHCLENLEMNRPSFSPKELEHLAQAKTLKKLKRLSIRLTSECTIEDLKKLQSNLPSLEYLHLGNENNAVSQYRKQIWPKTQRTTYHTYEAKRVKHFTAYCDDYTHNFEIDLEDAFDLATL